MWPPLASRGLPWSPRGLHSSQIRKGKIESHEILRWLMELPDYPELVSDPDPKVYKRTLLGRMRQWVQARRRGSQGTLEPATSSAKPGSALFMKTQLEKYNKDAKFRGAVTKLLKVDPSMAPLTTQSPPDPKSGKAATESYTLMISRVRTVSFRTVIRTHRRYPGSVLSLSGTSSEHIDDIQGPYALRNSTFDQLVSIFAKLVRTTNRRRKDEPG